MTDIRRVASPRTEEEQVFVDCCARFEVVPTQRQFRLWQRREGTAWTLAFQAAGHEKKLRARLDKLNEMKEI